MKEVQVTSPDRKIKFFVSSNPERLTWSAMLEDTVVIEPSPIDMKIDDYDLSSGIIFNNFVIPCIGIQWITGCTR